MYSRDCEHFDVLKYFLLKKVRDFNETLFSKKRNFRAKLKLINKNMQRLDADIKKLTRLNDKVSNEKGKPYVHMNFYQSMFLNEMLKNLHIYVGEASFISAQDILKSNITNKEGAYLVKLAKKKKKLISAYDIVFFGQKKCNMKQIPFIHYHLSDTLRHEFWKGYHYALTGTPQGYLGSCDFKLSDKNFINKPNE
jgi:hypothetical protein